MEKANKAEEKKPAKKVENTILFQNSKDEESGSEDADSSEESESADDEDDDVVGKRNEVDLSDLDDLKQSDVESDEEEVPEDVEKIGAFFDLAAGESDNLKVC